MLLLLLWLLLQNVVEPAVASSFRPAAAFLVFLVAIAYFFIFVAAFVVASAAIAVAAFAT